MDLATPHFERVSFKQSRDLIALLREDTPIKEAAENVGISFTLALTIMTSHLAAQPQE